MSTVRIAKFTQSVTVTWSDGSLFNGFILVGVVAPVGSAVDWSYTTAGDTYPPYRICLWSRVPIQAGKYNNDLGLFYTTDINPPGAVYVAYYYDSTGRQIAGPSGTFTVTSTPVTPPLPTLTAPSGTGTLPVPN